MSPHPLLIAFHNATPYLSLTSLKHPPSPPYFPIFPAKDPLPKGLPLSSTSPIPLPKQRLV